MGSKVPTQRRELFKAQVFASIFSVSQLRTAEFDRYVRHVSKHEDRYRRIYICIYIHMYKCMYTCGAQRPALQLQSRASQRFVRRLGCFRFFMVVNDPGSFLEASYRISQTDLNN